MAPPNEERRASESGRWDKVIDHMATQTNEMKYTRADIKEIKESLGGTNVLELRKTVTGHTETFNKMRGGAKVVGYFGGFIGTLYVFIKGLPLLKGLFNG